MRRELSWWDRVDAIVGWLSVASSLVLAAISGPFRGHSGASTYHHHIIQAAVKKLTIRFSPLQLQYLFKSYGQLYQAYCHKNEIKPNMVSTSRGVKGFWMGDLSAKYVIIYFHGGGFAMDATEPYLYFWPKIQKSLADSGIETAWFHSTYTLTPHASYPVQFGEAVETLRYVLEDIGRSPGDILIAGDSAGAGLCLSLLSHLTHYSKDAPELVINEPLKGAILLSPWVSFSHQWPSVKLNQHKDIDAQDVTARWSQLYLNGRSSNSYIEAVNAAEEWWTDIQVEQTLVLAGSDEVLLDPIKSWASSFKKSNPDTTLVIGINECHIAPLIWPMFGDFHETEQEIALKHWLIERLS